MHRMTTKDMDSKQVYKWLANIYISLELQLFDVKAMNRENTYSPNCIANRVAVSDV